jgi:hypothetical protein
MQAVYRRTCISSVCSLKHSVLMYVVASPLFVDGDFVVRLDSTSRSHYLITYRCIATLIIIIIIIIIMNSHIDD